MNAGLHAIGCTWCTRVIHAGARPIEYSGLCDQCRARGQRPLRPPLTRDSLAASILLAWIFALLLGGVFGWIAHGAFR